MKPSSKRQKAKKESEQRAAEVSFLLLTGGLFYFALEMICRGRSHISMAICGGVCLWLIYRVNEHLPKLILPVRALIGAGIITAVEFVTGCIVNLWLGLGVWDYSNQPLQLLGQICVPFSVLWFLLSVPVCWLCTLIRRFLFNYETD